MEISDLKNKVLLKHLVLEKPESILTKIKSNVMWDDSIVSRKTASFGVPYNYSNIEYETNEIPEFLNELVQIVKINNGFEPNNCLINFYYENSSRMGFHSDQIDILYERTGIAIFSLGSTRVLRFKNKSNREIVFDILLENNSYFYMSQEIQKEWLHAILPDKNESLSERISITFRKIISNRDNSLC